MGIHLRNKLDPARGPGANINTACRVVTNRKNVSASPVTDWLADVTCKKCRQTRWFKDLTRVKEERDADGMPFNH